MAVRVRTPTRWQDLGHRGEPGPRGPVGERGDRGPVGPPPPFQAVQHPPAVYFRAVLADDPIFFWPLDDTSGTIARDLTGRAVGAHAATYQGAFTLGASGIAQTAVALTGTGHVSAPYNNNPGQFSPLSFTAEIWCQPTSTGVPLVLINRANPATGALANQAMPWNLLLMTGLLPRWDVGDGQGAAASITATTGLTLGAWHHLVATYQRHTLTTGDLQIYANGQLVATGANATAPTPPSNLPILIGTWPSPNQRPFYGSLMRAAWYGHILPADRVLAHYEAGIP